MISLLPPRHIAALRKSSTLFAAFVIAAAPSVFATDYTWTAGATSTWNSLSAWSPAGSFPNDGALDNVAGNTTTSITNVNGAYAVNTFSPSMAGWTVYGSTVGASLSINTFASAVNFIIRDNAGTLGLTIGQLNVSWGAQSFGTSSSVLTSLTVTSGVALTGGGLSLNIGGDYNLGLLSTSGGTNSTINLVNANAGGTTRTATVSGLSSAGSGFVTIRTAASAVTNTANLRIENAADYSSNAVITNGGAGNSLNLIKAGAGSQTLTGASTYTGTTTVLAGMLIANNTAGSALGTGPVVVNASGILGGTGSIAGATAVSGAIAPGDMGIGNLAITNDVTWNGGTAWKMELGSANASDRLNITGAGSDFLKGTGSTWTIDFAGTGVSGNTYTLVDWAGMTDFVAGDFTAINLGSGLSGTFAINGSQLDFTVVPEPSSLLLLLGGGMGGLIFSRRSRRAINS